MNIYYIDYENVTSQGLKGIELLTEADEVNLLYSKKAETMKIDMLSQLIASRANIRFLPVHVGTPNALDFQLITLLFLHYTEGNNYYIISKDSGYDCCIKTAVENNAPNVFRFPNIESAAGGRQQKSQRTRRGSRSAQNKQTETVNAQSSAKETPSQSPAQPILEQKQADSQDAVQAGSQEAQNGSAQTKAQEAVQTDGTSKIAPSSDAEPVRESDTETTDAPQADAAAAVPEENGRKRPARRRGRRKSASAVQTEAESAEDVREDVKEEKHEQPREAAAVQREQTPPRQNRDAQGQGQKQSQPQRQQTNSRPEADKSDKPVTVLSVIRRRNDVQLDLNQIDMIRNALKTSSNKQQFYNYFVKKLGQKKGIELYHSIKSSYTDLINANLI